MFTKIRHSRVGFTLIELLVGMTIFSIALTSIYLLLTSTMKSVTYSRNEIIVSNLLREQMELMRNIRDSNIAKGAAWDAWKVFNDKNSKIFKEWIYTIENDFSQTETVFGSDGIDKLPVKVAIAGIDKTAVAEVKDDTTLKEKFEKTQLCFDEKKRYVHCTNDAHKTSSGTVFASYINIIPMYFKEGNDTPETLIQIPDDSGVPQNQGYIIDARVIVRDGSYYREYDVRTALTDWQK